ncbi:MAG: SUMF1/EgtB/PvdO family nonheme iron enzyme [Acidobacteria bacterium]|nr:SUMF1/EgtB/PvdO family nonheme iron enzyme [Acidobacteriota bacterium]
MPKENEQIGDYTLVSAIRRGSTSEVWLAEDKEEISSGETKKVAIKFIEVDKTISFEVIKKEAKIWEKVSGNPNILPLIKVRKYKNEQVMFVSEYVEEGSLQDWLKKHNYKSPSEELAVEIVIKILNGLEYLHEQKILHRDLKPANILMQKGFPKLADFGLSRRLESINSGGKDARGTPDYMAPETFEGKGKEQADIWAVGVILYEMLSGSLPFEAEGFPLMSVIQSTPKKLPKEISKEVQAVVFQALEKELNKRYKTAKEMRQDLERILIKNQLKEYPFETIVLDSYAQIIKRKKGEALYFEEYVGNNVKLEMVNIPSGEFVMGGRDNQSCEEEKPLHKVTVSEFYISKYQITQKQWKEIMSYNPSYFKGEQLPVETVSWYEAILFCKKLSEKTNKEYRLPSEAEWEYAARARTTTSFAFGETITSDIVNCDGSELERGTTKSVYRKKTVEVGSLGVANEFGLYDMHGNVWEWCEDLWHSNYVKAPTDARSWDNDTIYTNRVLRGGSWFDTPSRCRSAWRGNDAPDSSFYLNGFRVVVKLI